MTAYDWIDEKIPIPLALYFNNEGTWELVKINDALNEFWNLDERPISLMDDEIDPLYAACEEAAKSNKPIGRSFHLKNSEGKLEKFYVVLRYMPEDEVILVSFMSASLIEE